MAHSQRSPGREIITFGGELGVMKLKDKYTIIRLKEEGHSNHEIQRMTGIHRKTVAKYWSEYQAELSMLGFNDSLRDIQELIVSAPKYDTRGRGPIKYTKEIDAALDVILAAEDAKDSILGPKHKQKLTGVQIYGLIKAAGHDISLTVIAKHIKIKRDIRKEAFIRQEYEYGQRLEYDFGEARLRIGGVLGKYYLAVLSSPRAGFRWAYLYRTQKKDVFLDSHVRFFEMAGGAYRETVYDNMKNVVTRFIGRSGKHLNEDLIKMSIYYGFRVNVTNCFSGNEKGHVESSVKAVRNKIFAMKYQFESFEEAEAYLAEGLATMNAGSGFEEEKQYLLPYRPPLELAHMSHQRVDKYSFVRVENNFYSVPEYLAGRQVQIKNYATEIVVYSGGSKVCSHKKKTGFHETSVEITHYLETFLRKPGALKNSAALRSKEELKAVFDEHYTGKERFFIEIIKENQNVDFFELIRILKGATPLLGHTPLKEIEDNVMAMAKSQILALSELFMADKGAAHVN